MKNIKLIGAIIASLVISTSSFAGELTFTGSAEVAYNINGSDGALGKNDKGKALGISNDITWTGSGETDNGWSWVVSGDLDSGTVDDTYFTLTMGDMGTLGFYNNDGSLNQKHSANVSVYKVGSDSGATGSITDAYDLSGYSNIRYTLPAILPFGTTLAVASYVGGTSATVDPGDQGAVDTIKSATHYQLTTAPVEGLKIMADYYNEDAQGAVVDGKQKKESGTLGATYAVGGFKLGVSESRVAPAHSTTQTSTYNYIQNRTMSAAFAVNDAFSVSYAQEKSAKKGQSSVTTYDIDVTSIQAAYTVGGMTLSILQENIDNAGYATGVDEKEVVVGLKMAF
jgi:outer membrane protein OmpU